MIVLCVLTIGVVAIAAMTLMYKTNRQVVNGQMKMTVEISQAVSRAVEQAVHSVVAPPPLVPLPPPENVDSPGVTWDFGGNESDDEVDPTDWLISDARVPVIHGGDFGLPPGAFEANGA